MNSEALRLLDDAVRAHDYGSRATFVLRMSELRALLSAQGDEPTAEHWRQAAQEVAVRVSGVYLLSVELAKMESRARELAKQEAK